MKAVLVSADDAVIKDVPIPEPDDDEILIRNVAVAANPKDWKMPTMIKGYSAVEGNDVAGDVVKIGSKVHDFKIKDKVAGFSKMATANKYGAYAEYTVVPAHTAFHLSPNTTYEDAAAFPLAYMTAAVGLFKKLGLPEPDQAKEGTSVLIYGGATNVGVYAIQLAKLAKLHVVAVAGSMDHVKEYGADEVINYRGKTEDQLVDAMAKSAGGNIHHIFDTVAENGTTEIAIKVLAKTGGGKYTITLPESKDIEKVPGVESAGFTHVGSVHGDNAEFGRKWYTKLGELLSENKIKPQKVVVMEGGLAGVKEGLRRLKANEVRAAKLVYRVSDTPGLESGEDKHHL